MIGNEKMVVEVVSNMVLTGEIDAQNPGGKQSNEWDDQCIILGHNVGYIWNWLNSKVKTMLVEKLVVVTGDDKEYGMWSQ